MVCMTTAMPCHGMASAVLFCAGMAAAQQEMVCNCKGVLHRCMSTLCEAAASLCGARPHVRPAAHARHSAGSAACEKVV